MTSAAASLTLTPIKLGLLYDFPQGDGGAGFELALRLGIEREYRETARPVEFITRHARGLPIGSEHELKLGFDELVDAGALMIVGPSISDNALVAAPLADAARIAVINYSGGERTRSEWMLHFQVGSLEEEPPFIAARLKERGFGRVAVLFDNSPVGRRYFEAFDTACGRSAITITASSVFRR